MAGVKGGGGDASAMPKEGSYARANADERAKSRGEVKRVGSRGWGHESATERKAEREGDDHGDRGRG